MTFPTKLDNGSRMITSTLFDVTCIMVMVIEQIPRIGFSFHIFPNDGKSQFRQLGKSMTTFEEQEFSIATVSLD